MLCARCGEEKRKSNLLEVKLNGTQGLVCTECFFKLKEEYRLMKSCESCAFYRDDLCEKLKMRLQPETVIGYSDFYSQAEKCKYYIIEKEYQERAMKGELEEKQEGKEKEIIREKEVIVKIRCSYCRNLYNETLDKCPHCGGKN